VPAHGGAAPLTRSYSLSDVAGEHGYRISVKREGAGSGYLHDRVSAGDVLEVAAPRGSFVLRDGTGPVVLISAGVGATPVLAMLHALARERSDRAVWWIHGARNRDEHAFAAEAEELLATLPDAHRPIAYSRPAGQGGDHDISGRLDLAALERAGVPADADYYVCGPDGFMQTIGAALAARGVLPERIATEVFGAFEACDVPVGFGCRNGTCHNCESGLLAGEVTYFTEPLEPPPAGRVLVCSTRPSSALTLDL
jgi:ferredoxin-NADP reductase